MWSFYLHYYKFFMYMYMYYLFLKKTKFYCGLFIIKKNKTRKFSFNSWTKKTEVLSCSLKTRFYRELWKTLGTHGEACDPTRFRSNGHHLEGVITICRRAVSTEPSIMTVLLASLVIGLLCFVVVGVSSSVVHYDQSQSGDVNVQVHLKNIEVFAILDDALLGEVRRISLLLFSYVGLRSNSF